MTAEVAKRYDIKDPISNYVPPSIRSLKFLIPSLILGSLKLSSAEKTKWKWLESWLISLLPDILLPMSLMAQGAPEQQKT